MGDKLTEAQGPTIYLTTLWPPIATCCICEREHVLSHSVGYYCGPTHAEVGSITTEYTDGGIVGGMPACQPCHDKFYGIAALARHEETK